MVISREQLAAFRIVESSLSYLMGIVLFIYIGRFLKYQLDLSKGSLPTFRPDDAGLLQGEVKYADPLLSSQVGTLRPSYNESAN